MGKLINGCLALIVFLGTCSVHAQKKNEFDAAVNIVKKNVQCCSVLFSGKQSVKATAVLVFSGGAMTIVYNNGRVPVSFNLFELYKDVQAPLGIQHKTGSRVIEFKIDEFNTQTIRFNTVAKARDTYKQLSLILKADHENYRPVFPLTIRQTIDSINALLRITNNDRAMISLINDRVFKTAQMPSIRYDIDVTKLKNADTLSVFQVKGIGFIPYVKDGFGTGARISFQQGNQKMGFLQLTSSDTHTQAMIYRLFIHLCDLMRKG